MRISDGRSDVCSSDLGAMPTPAPGFTVTRFAGGLDYPRWLYVLPNGDVLVAETNGPGKSGVTGLKGAVMKQVMKRAGAGVPSTTRIKNGRGPSRERVRQNDKSTVVEDILKKNIS